MYVHPRLVLGGIDVIVVNRRAYRCRGSVRFRQQHIGDRECLVRALSPRRAAVGVGCRERMTRIGRKPSAPYPPAPYSPSSLLVYAWTFCCCCCCYTCDCDIDSDVTECIISVCVDECQSGSLTRFPHRPRMVNLSSHAAFEWTWFKRLSVAVTSTRVCRHGRVERLLGRSTGGKYHPRWKK